jgi:hypothetical protein
MRDQDDHKIQISYRIRWSGHLEIRNKKSRLNLSQSSTERIIVQLINTSVQLVFLFFFYWKTGAWWFSPLSFSNRKTPYVHNQPTFSNSTKLKRSFIHSSSSVFFIVGDFWTCLRFLIFLSWMWPVFKRTLGWLMTIILLPGIAGGEKKKAP